MPLFASGGSAPQVHPDAYVAPTATLSGEVVVEAGAAILFGAVLTAEGGPVRIGPDCVVMENAVLRGTRNHALVLGARVLVGPRAYLTGCRIEDEVFLATGAIVFNGAVVGARAEVRLNGIVHVNSRLAADATVPIGWVAVGDPAEVMPPERHDDIWAIQKLLDFPRTVFGLERPPPGESLMPDLMPRYAAALRRRHAGDREVS
jgi:carbonic anhydrase/acetyltransferase-like protein (isoleucine patch superfamily)